MVIISKICLSVSSFLEVEYRDAYRQVQVKRQLLSRGAQSGIVPACLPREDKMKEKEIRENVVRKK